MSSSVKVWIILAYLLLLRVIAILSVHFSEVNSRIYNTLFAIIWFHGRIFSKQGIVKTVVFFCFFVMITVSQRPAILSP